MTADEIRSLLEHARKVAAEVAAWPEWKRREIRYFQDEVPADVATVTMLDLRIG